jgi:hypothetical protein
MRPPAATPAARQTGAVVEEEVLSGGVANSGTVVRRGDEVLRPARASSVTVHALLRHVRNACFHGVAEPRGIDPDGRERLSYIPGDVPTPPFPAWSQTEGALASTAVLLRRFHDATVGFVPPEGGTWDRELADPLGGDVICHNDVCPENVVFRDGAAVALLDFDFAAPGRRVFDLASLARMCIPLDAAEDAARTGRGGLDPFYRLRVVTDAYGLPAGRSELIDVIGEQLAVGGAFVQRRVDAGDEAFTAMWNAMGGNARYERRRDWFERHRRQFLDVVG